MDLHEIYTYAYFMTFMNKTETLAAIPYNLKRFLLEDCGIRLDIAYIYTQTYPTFFLNVFSTLKLTVIEHKIETAFGYLVIEQRHENFKLVENTIEEY